MSAWRGGGSAAEAEARKAGPAGHRIAAELEALRRVATLVAGGPRPEEVFSAVAAEVGQLLMVDVAVLVRYDPAHAVTIVATWTRTGAVAPSPVGTRLPLGGRNVTTLIFQTGRPARIDYDHVSGSIGAVAQDWQIRSSLGVPILVEGRIWGGMIVAFTSAAAIAADAESRLAGFTELVATAVANAQARVELGNFAEEQEALRRVAMMVARAAAPEEVFAAVAAEEGRLLGSDLTVMVRYDPDQAATAIGAWSGTDRPIPFPVGTRERLGGQNVITRVHETGRPIRIDEYADAREGPAEVASDWGIRSGIGAPITIDGRLWGAISMGFTPDEPPPPDAETRLAAFTKLLATAIANTNARAALRGFAEEQAALHRVARLVARAAPPDEVFTVVAEEIGRLLDVDYTVMSRYDPDGFVTVVGGWSKTDPGRPLAIGLRLKPEGQNIHALVFRTARPARIDNYAETSGQFADVARDWAYRASVGVPITVEDRLWGVMIVGSREAALPPDTEGQLSAFTELVATAIANAEARAALTASRARIVAASDATRRRIERDLHDGAQQRLVSLALRVSGLKAVLPAEAKELAGHLDRAAAELTRVLDELRELARGLHPTSLTNGGLRPALKTLARRCALPVRLDIALEERLPEQVELAAYFAVAEALANAAKYAQGGVVDVEAHPDETELHLCVRDDGVGGADPGRGSGLIALTDRIEALGGRLGLHSPPGGGTTLRITLPLTTPAEPW
ncbi:MAG: GAF domain-containing sensor histidine kinase [Blastococcus sp.]